MALDGTDPLEIPVSTTGRLQCGGRASVRCDEIYQLRGVTAGAGDTEKQSPTLDKYSDDASRSRIERARLLFKREGSTRDRPPGDLQLRWTVTTWDCKCIQI